MYPYTYLTSWSIHLIHAGTHTHTFIHLTCRVLKRRCTKCCMGNKDLLSWPLSKVFMHVNVESFSKDEYAERIQRLYSLLLWVLAAVCHPETCGAWSLNNCCWSFLYCASRRSGAGSVRSHVILHNGYLFIARFWNIHRSGGMAGAA